MSTIIVVIEADRDGFPAAAAEDGDSKNTKNTRPSSLWAMRSQILGRNVSGISQKMRYAAHHCRIKYIGAWLP